MSGPAEGTCAVFGSDDAGTETLQRVRTLVNAVDDGLFQLDADGRFVAVNDAVVQATGYERASLLGDHVSDLLADGSSAVERRLTSPTERSELLEVTVETADGSQVDWEVRTSLLETDDGSRETVGVVRDCACPGSAGAERTERDSTERGGGRGEAPEPDSDEREREGARDEREQQQTRDSTCPLERERVLEALEAAREGISLLDDDGTFLYLNDAYAATFGYDREEMIGEHWDDLGIESDPDRVYDEILPTAVEDGQWTGTTTCARSDGSTFRSEHSLTHTEDGQLVCIVRDVSDREEHEQDLARYETIVEAVDDGVYVVEDGRFAMVNDAYAQLLGYDREELLGEHVSKFVDEDVLQQAQELEAAILDDEADDPVIEAELETADGDLITAEATFAMLPDGEGYGQRVGVVRDVTERRERERKLERYERIVENLPVGVYRNTPGPDGEFVAGNSTLADIFGADSVDELLEYSVSDLYVDPDQRAEFSETLESEGVVEDYELKQETLDGETIWISVTAIETEEDGEVYFDGTVQDVTERKRTQQQLAEERDMFAQGPAVVFRWKNEPGWPVEYVSENVEDVFGYAPAELESGDVPYTELLLQDELDRIAREVEANSDETTQRFSHEPYRVRTGDGDVRWVNDTTTIIRDDDGEITHYLGYLVDITERKERERKLAESEQRYRTLVENFSNGAVALVDEDLRFQTVGGTPVDVSSDTAADLEGNCVRDALTPALADAVVPKYRAALEGDSSTFELEHDGRHSRIHIFPVRDDDGEVFAAMGMSQDLTERERTKRKLETSERRHRTLVEHFPNGAVAMFDENLEYTAAGGQVLDDLGTSQEAIVGQTVREHYPEELATQFEPNFQAAIEDGEQNAFDMELHGKHWEAHTLPVRDGGGEIFAGMLMIQDVTEQVEREQALEESKNQLQALIELLPVAVFVAEADGEIVEWNEAAEEVWGGEIAESDSIAEYDEYDGWWVDSGEPVEPDEWALARALRGEEVTDPDVVEIEGFDGERRTVLNHGMPVRDADGEVTRAVVTLTDITERREYQRRLEESNERLEQFAYAASHDLQEPLRMVSSYLQLIERRYCDELDEDGQEFIGYAVDGADRMRDMIEGLLEYSRVETRGDSFEPVDLEDVLADVREDLQMRIVESDAEISVASLPRVRGDEEQLRQVFQNLFDNAIEYSGDEPPQIEVSAERRRDRWEITVRDEGIGIEREQTDRVFEIFQRLHTPENHSGTGIGLALCQRIVERHGGELWVESEPDEGSTFSFTLPAAGDCDE